MKARLMGLSVSILALLGAGVSITQVSALDTSRDCDQYAIIRCGTMSPNELRTEYASNNANGSNGYSGTQSDIQRIFSAMNISRDSLNGTFKNGVVYRNGEVKVDGKTVATGAVMAARGLGGTQIAGTNAQRVSVSAMGDAQTAMVKMDGNGKFLYAVMKPCGNPVTATPTETTPPQQPEPKPGVTIEKYVNRDKKYQRVNENVEFSYRIVVKNTGETNLKNVKVTDTPQAGITLLSVQPPVGQIRNNVFTYTIPQLSKGESRSFAITAKVPAYKAGKLVNTVCVDAPEVPGNPDKCDKATVEVPPTPVPGKIEVCVLADKTIQQIEETAFNPSLHSKNLDDCEETVTPPELPKTGMVDSILSMVGAMSLAGSGAYYAMSRRQL